MIPESELKDCGVSRAHTHTHTHTHTCIVHHIIDSNTPYRHTSHSVHTHTLMCTIL